MLSCLHTHMPRILYIRTYMHTCIHTHTYIHTYTHATDTYVHQIGMLSRSDVFWGMDEGLCQLGLVYQQDFQRAHSDGQSCDKMLVGESIYTSAQVGCSCIHACRCIQSCMHTIMHACTYACIYTTAQGLPMAPSRGAALSYLVQRATNGGHWTSYKRRHQPFSRCDQTTGTPLNQVSASDFLGQAMLAWVLLLLGALLALTLGRFNRFGIRLGIHRMAIDRLGMATDMAKGAAASVSAQAGRTFQAGRTLPAIQQVVAAVQSPRDVVPRDVTPIRHVVCAATAGKARPGPPALRQVVSAETVRPEGWV